MSRKLRESFVDILEQFYFCEFWAKEFFGSHACLQQLTVPTEKRREGCGKIPGEKRNIVWRVLVVGLIRGKEV
jgi:hypothetical protein